MYLSLFKLGRGKSPGREPLDMLKRILWGDYAKTSHGWTELLGGLDRPLDLNQTLEDLSDVSYLQAILFENPTVFSGFKKSPGILAQANK